MVRVAFVCLGNICRSPTAHGIFLALVRERGLDDRISVRSAGTSASHVGERPDRRSQATANARGVELPGHSEQFHAADFDQLDYVLAMDAQNHRNLLRVARSETDRAKVHFLRDFDPNSPAGSEVPDPYYGGARGFDEVFDLCDAACRGLLTHIESELG